MEPHLTVQCLRELKERGEERHIIDATQQVLEGTTYESGVDAFQCVGERDIEVIDPPVTLTKPVTVSGLNIESVLVFDLETTGLGVDSSIIQIAAAHLKTGETFNVYVQPESGSIARKISTLTGIDIHGGVMFSNMSPVPSVHATRALERFMGWIEKYESPILVAHNVLFDSKILVQQCCRHSIDLCSISGLADSLKLLKEYYPGISNYRQTTLIAHEILGLKFNAHNAIGDVATLSNLLETVPNLETRITVFTVDDIKDRLSRLKNEKRHLPSFEQLISAKILTKKVSKQLAASGLNKRQLETVCNRSGIDRLSLLLKNRITRPTKTAQQLCAALYTGSCYNLSFISLTVFYQCKIAYSTDVR